MKYLVPLFNCVLCPVMLTGACVLDSELSPDIPANALNHADDLDAGADEGSKREAKKIAPATIPRSSATPTPPDPHATARGPYYRDDPWHGYFWIAKTGKDTTLTPSKSFADKTFDAEICIKGSVAATSDSSGNAMLGVNVNQFERTDAVPLLRAPSRDGVQVEVKNNAGSPIRVQVAAQDGTSNADAHWCAVVNGSGGFIPWTAFNTACWDGSGKPYKHEHITVAMLLVPGNARSAVPYDFCLQRLTESKAPPPGVGAGAAPRGDD